MCVKDGELGSGSRPPNQIAAPLILKRTVRIPRGGHKILSFGRGITVGGEGEEQRDETLQVFSPVLLTQAGKEGRKGWETPLQQDEPSRAMVV